MTRPGIEPQSPGPLVNIQLIRQMAQYLICIIIKKILETYSANGESKKITIF